MRLGSNLDCPEVAYVYQAEELDFEPIWQDQDADRLAPETGNEDLQ
jgi:hypothetical protein